MYVNLPVASMLCLGYCSLSVLLMDMQMYITPTAVFCPLFHKISNACPLRRKKSHSRRAFDVVRWVRVLSGSIIHGI